MPDRQALAYFFHQIASVFVFDIQICIARELHRINPGGLFAQGLLQAAADDVVEEGDSMVLPLGREGDKAWQISREFQQGRRSFILQGHDEVEGFVFEEGRLAMQIQAYRLEAAGDFGHEIIVGKGLLSRAKALIGYQVNALCLQSRQNLLPKNVPKKALLLADDFADFSQFLAGLDLQLQFFTLLFFQAAEAAQGSHAHAEELVEVGAVNG